MQICGLPAGVATRASYLLRMRAKASVRMQLVTTTLRHALQTRFWGLVYIYAGMLRTRRRQAIFVLSTFVVTVYLTLHLLRSRVHDENLAYAGAVDGQEVRKSPPVDERVVRAIVAQPAAGVTDETESTNSSPPDKTKAVGVSFDKNAAPSGGECSWVNFTIPGPPYFLTAVFIVRIYENDLSEMTAAQVKQWLLYLLYAGVEHVYLYDLWYLPGESQREPLDIFVREGYLTYHDRHELNPYVRQKSQLPSYQHCINEYGKDSVWQAAIDIDEYPFSSEDTAPGFMARSVKKYSDAHSDLSEMTMENFLYLGEKNKSREFLMDQLWRHTHGPSNRLVKPVYKPLDISSAQVHHNNLQRGHSRSIPSGELRINHYWGARLQNWGPDTEKTLAKTEDDRRMEPIVAAFKKCDHFIRKYL